MCVCPLTHSVLPAFPTRRSSDLSGNPLTCSFNTAVSTPDQPQVLGLEIKPARSPEAAARNLESSRTMLRSEEHTSELQSPCNLVCRLLLEQKKSGDDQPRTESRR